MNTLFIFDSKNTFKFGIRLLKYFDNLHFLESETNSNTSDLSQSVDSYIGKINIVNKKHLSKIFDNKTYENVIIYTENEELNIVCGYVVSKINPDTNINIINSSLFYGQTPYVEQCSVISGWSLVFESIKKELKFLKKGHSKEFSSSTYIVKTNKKDLELGASELSNFTYKTLHLKDKHDKSVSFVTNDAKFAEFSGFFKKNRAEKIFKIGVFCSSFHIDFIHEIDFFNNSVCFLVSEYETNEPHSESIKNIKINDIKEGDIDLVLCLNSDEKENILKSMYFSEKLGIDTLSIFSSIEQGLGDATIIEREKLIINKILKNTYIGYFSEILFLDDDFLLISVDKNKNDIFKDFNKKRIEELLEAKIISAEKQTDFFLHDFSEYKWQEGDIVNFLVKSSKINDFVKNYENA